VYNNQEFIGLKDITSKMAQITEQKANIIEYKEEFHPKPWWSTDKHLLEKYKTQK